MAFEVTRMDLAKAIGYTNGPSAKDLIEDIQTALESQGKTICDDRRDVYTSDYSGAYRIVIDVQRVN